MSHTANLEAVIQQIGLLGQSQFGKSPESVTIRANEHSVVIFLNELIDPDDERLPDDPDERYTHVYILLDQFVFPAIRRKIESAAGQKIIHHFIDWKEEVNCACIAIMFELAPDRKKEDLYTGKAELHIRVSQITEDVQKSPAEIESYWIDSTTLVVIRKGLLISLEKRIIKKGFNNALRVSKRELELDRFIHDLPVRAILGKTLEQAFLDWDFANDISLMVLTFPADKWGAE
ncbi:Na-translocating system protein MpsC family protein [Paenibacillus campi]|uniref:Na-translocating system protein MpsC family protein n=1 Tax=Paenibacillus campi TaxID=3106031 RepID=UPI002AFE4001|nr:Na-translocating system protein MpsC family protein [Paenibacillus sp. SGZ-1014]